MVERASFTEVLYGVVIGFAIAGLETPWFTRHNALLLLALVLIFDDYLLYNTAVTRVLRSGRSTILLFWLDVLVLLAWYALCLAGDESLPTYFVCVGLFFAVASLWEVIFTQGPLWRRALLAGDVLLVALASGLAIASARLGGPEWPYVAGFFLALALWRFQDYVAIWKR